MIKTGILNPAINSLLSRIRHTNTLVIADRGFPNWPQVETIDIALIDDIPRVLDVLRAILPNFTIGSAVMAEEFRSHNTPETYRAFASVVAPIDILFQPHLIFKKMVPQAIGLIRTGDTTQYGNIILESG
jgi:D-ribose pyranase